MARIGEILSTMVINAHALWVSMMTDFRIGVRLAILLVSNALEAYLQNAQNVRVWIKDL